MDGLQPAKPFGCAASQSVLRSLVTGHESAASINPRRRPSCSAVRPSLFTIFGSAPCARSSLATATAASSSSGRQKSGVMPALGATALASGILGEQLA